MQAQFDSNRSFGVEIETAVRGNEVRIARALVAAGIEASAPGYTHNASRTTWKVVPDGSTGSEVVSPILKGQDGLNQIKAVCEVLTAIGCRVDSSTGLHVHHDFTDGTAKQMKNVAYMAAKMQKLTNALLPSRVNSRWAKQLNITEMDSIYKRISNVRGFYNSDVAAVAGSLTHGDRYYLLNTTAYNRHSTIEFRQHTGSLNATKIISWVVFTQNIVNVGMAKNQVAKMPQSAHSFIEHSLWLLGSDANCAITKAARKNIVQRIFDKNNTLDFGTAKRYLTTAQRRTLRQRAA